LNLVLSTNLVLILFIKPNVCHLEEASAENRDWGVGRIGPRSSSSSSEGKSPTVGEGVVVVSVVVEGAMLVNTAGKMEEKKKVVA
jgi:hypothetical protein